MKVLLLSLILSAVPYWGSGTIALPGDGECQAHRKIVVVKGDGADGDGVKVVKRLVTSGDDGAVAGCCDHGGDADVNCFVVSDDGDGNKKVECKVVVTPGAEGHGDHLLVSADGDVAGAGEVVMMVDGNGDGRSEVRRFVVKAGGKDRGYLGVSIANVPDALADQLDLDGRGILIQNVVEGGPADKAGLEAHDILLSVDGVEVEGDLARAVKLVGDHKPGEEVAIVVLRDGDELELPVTLGARDAAPNAFQWKFETAPDAEIEDHVQAFGKIMRRDEDGNWVIENLGDLEGLKNLPGNLKMFMPKIGSRTMQIFNTDGHKKIKVKTVKDGNVLIVEQNEDGITVTRVDEDGNETTETYADADELEAADEEAFGLLQHSNTSVGINVDVDGLGEAIADIEVTVDDLGDLVPGVGRSFTFEFDSDELKEHMGEWREKLEESLGEAREAHGHAMEELREIMENLKSEGKLGASGTLSKAMRGLHRIRGLGEAGKPRHSFEVAADGKIIVRLRRGDSELVRIFDSEDDLADRRPKLFDKYQKLIEADEDE